jgi:membrane associated rhomboid family serine protease
LAARSSQPILNAPASVRWIVGVTVLVHVLRLIMPAGIEEELFNVLAFVPDRYAAGNPAGSLLLKALTPLGHMLLHADWMHLIMNMAFFMAFGSAVARRMGPVLFFLFYVLCGVFAAFFWMWLYGSNEAVLIGASGAISGMVGAVCRVSLWPPRRLGSALPLWNRRMIINFVLIWLALNLVFGFVPVFVGDNYGGIAWEAHLGGFLAGFLLIGLFDGRGRMETIARDPGFL